MCSSLIIHTANRQFQLNLSGWRISKILLSVEYVTWKKKKDKRERCEMGHTFSTLTWYQSICVYSKTWDSFLHETKGEFIWFGVCVSDEGISTWKCHWRLLSQPLVSKSKWPVKSGHNHHSTPALGVLYQCPVLCRLIAQKLLILGAQSDLLRCRNTEI